MKEVIAELLELRARYHKEPFESDSDVATTRDLDYFDEVMRLLDKLAERRADSE